MTLWVSILFRQKAQSCLVIGINDGELVTYENRGSAGNRVLTVRLAGHSGNPTAIGSRVTLELSDGRSQTAEVHAGSGYLSQSSATLTFGLGSTATAQLVTVRWPDGTTSTTLAESEPQLVISQPPSMEN